MLRTTAIMLQGSGGSSSHTSLAQVLGAGVPVFRQYPYCASETLRLYMNFLRLIRRHCRPEEQHDLMFRLRQEFNSRRHLRGPKRIAAALRRGEGILCFQRHLLESHEDGAAGCRRNLSPITQRLFNEKECRNTSRRSPAVSVSGSWAQLQRLAGNTVPGLRHYYSSLPVDGVRSYSGRIRKNDLTYLYCRHRRPQR